MSNRTYKKSTDAILRSTAIAVTVLLSFGGTAKGQARGSSASSGAATAAGGSMGRNIGRDTSPLNAENSLELVKPADKSEETAFRQFQEVSVEDPSKKIAVGEKFVKKYSKSVYLPVVYSQLTSAYLETNQVQKMEEAGEKAIALNPKDVQVLAMLSQTLPRMIDASTPEPEKQLNKAEEYAKRAIEQIPNIAKPANISDQEFGQAKNQILAIAHSGLGLVDFRRNDFAGAITELDQAVKLDPRSDATNYYVLAVANHNAEHYAEAVKNFNKCAQFSGNLQAVCKEAAEKDKGMADAQSAHPQ